MILPERKSIRLKGYDYSSRGQSFSGSSFLFCSKTLHSTSSRSFELASLERSTFGRFTLQELSTLNYRAQLALPLNTKL